MAIIHQCLNNRPQLTRLYADQPVVYFFEQALVVLAGQPAAHGYRVGDPSTR